MKEQIKKIIENYCEGITHLEFNIADLDKMADEILSLQLQQTVVSISVDRAQNYAKHQFNRGVLGYNFVEFKEWQH